MTDLRSPALGREPDTPLGGGSRSRAPRGVAARRGHTDAELSARGAPAAARWLCPGSCEAGARRRSPGAAAVSEPVLTAGMKPTALGRQRSSRRWPARGARGSSTVTARRRRRPLRAPQPGLSGRTIEPARTGGHVRRTGACRDGGCRSGSTSHQPRPSPAAGRRGTRLPVTETGPARAGAGGASPAIRRARCRSPRSTGERSHGRPRAGARGARDRGARRGSAAAQAGERSRSGVPVGVPRTPAYRSKVQGLVAPR